MTTKKFTHVLKGDSTPPTPGLQQTRVSPNSESTGASCIVFDTACLGADGLRITVSHNGASITVASAIPTKDARANLRACERRVDFAVAHLRAARAEVASPSSNASASTSTLPVVSPMARPVMHNSGPGTSNLVTTATISG